MSQVFSAKLNRKGSSSRLLAGLILCGKYDMNSPYETSVQPMYDLLGTPKEDKRLILYDTDHFIPRNEFTREALRWLDRYLGTVE